MKWNLVKERVVKIILVTEQQIVVVTKDIAKRLWISDSLQL